MGMFSSKNKEETYPQVNDAYKDASNSPSSDDDVPRNEKSHEELERIHTFERVGTHAQYYEKGGLRTEGDGVDHDGAHHHVRCTEQDSTGVLD